MRANTRFPFSQSYVLHVWVGKSAFRPNLPTGFDPFLPLAWHLLSAFRAKT